MMIIFATCLKDIILYFLKVAPKLRVNFTWRWPLLPHNIHIHKMYADNKLRCGVIVYSTHYVYKRINLYDFLNGF